MKKLNRRGIRTLIESILQEKDEMLDDQQIVDDFLSGLDFSGGNKKKRQKAFQKVADELEKGIKKAADQKVVRDFSSKINFSGELPSEAETEKFLSKVVKNVAGPEKARLAKAAKSGSGGLSAGGKMSGGGDASMPDSKKQFDRLARKKDYSKELDTHYSREGDSWGYYRKNDTVPSGWQYAERKNYKKDKTVWLDVKQGSKGARNLKAAEKDGKLTKLKLDESHMLSRGALYRRRYYGRY